MKRLFFSKEEKFHLESIAAQRDNLALQDMLLKNEAETVISNFCKRNSVETKGSIKFNIDLKQGFIELSEKTQDPTTPDAIKKKSKK